MWVEGRKEGKKEQNELYFDYASTLFTYTHYSDFKLGG